MLVCACIRERERITGKMFMCTVQMGPVFVVFQYRVQLYRWVLCVMFQYMVQLY